MSFGAGLLTGVAGGLDRQKQRVLRDRELAAMEGLAAARGAPGSFNRAEYRPPARGQADPHPQDAGGWDASAVSPDIVTGIIEAADELGMNPEMLATYISYETAGTFNPRQKGPVTQWGQHEGFIQWGEPQAKQYGVDWNDPVRSQLGRDGAVVRYFRDRGWQPGMSEVDGYSIINAGSPGRGGASDAGNGGAPGTVADKVNTQMGGHRAKARALLAKYQPAPAPAAPATPMASDWFTGFFPVQE